MGSSTGTNKKVYFELMRIIACSEVIFGHLPGYHLFEETEGVAWLFYMSITLIVRLSVPLFFMISGALLLGRDDEWSKVFRKRFVRMAVLLMAFSFILMSFNTLHSIKHGLDYDFSFLGYIHGFLDNSIEYSDPYWYMYSYLGMLFMLPMLQRVAKGLTKKEMTALLVLHIIITSVLPFINVFMQQMGWQTFTYTKQFAVPLALQRSIFFPLLGYYIENNIDMAKVKAKHLWGLTAAALAGLLIADWCTYMEGAMNGEYSQNFFMMSEFILAIWAYVLIKYLFVKAAPKLGEGRAAKVICFAGALTLGIYLWDPCLKVLLYGKYDRLTESVLPVFVASLGWVVVSMILGGFITFVLKKIPGIKRFI